MPCVETHAVSSSPSHEATARVRLERRLQLRRRVEIETSTRHVGGSESRLGVTPRIVGRLADEVLLVDGLLRVDDVREHLDVERERLDAGPCRLERVGGDDGDRLAGVARLGREEWSRASSATARSRARSRPERPGPPAPRRGRASAPARARRVSGARPRGASPRAARRPCSARVPWPARRRRGAGAGLPTSVSSSSGVQLSDVVRLVDERPDVLVAALHLLLGANEAGCHAPPAARRMARSIFG